MFRSTHQLAVQMYKQKLEDSQIRYAVLESYYKHIQDLHADQISDLRKLVFATSQHDVPETLVEADKVLTQNQDMPFPDEITDFESRERDRLLSGGWDEVLPN